MIFFLKKKPKQRAAATPRCPVRHGPRASCLRHYRRRRAQPSAAAAAPLCACAVCSLALLPSRAAAARHADAAAPLHAPGALASSCRAIVRVAAAPHIPSRRCCYRPLTPPPPHRATCSCCYRRHHALASNARSRLAARVRHCPALSRRRPAAPLTRRWERSRR